jgi:hypothetical protein
VVRSLLDAMRRNPVGDWTIEDIERECRVQGLKIAPPRGGGSHWKVWSAERRRSLIIPARRPLKTVYVKLFIALVDECGDGQ